MTKMSNSKLKKTLFMNKLVSSMTSERKTFLNSNSGIMYRSRHVWWPSETGKVTQLLLIALPCSRENESLLLTFFLTLTLKHFINEKQRIYSFCHSVCISQSPKKVSRMNFKKLLSSSKLLFKIYLLFLRRLSSVCTA